MAREELLKKLKEKLTELSPEQIKILDRFADFLIEVSQETGVTHSIKASQDGRVTQSVRASQKGGVPRKRGNYAQNL